MARGWIWWPEFAFSIPSPVSRWSGIDFSVASSILRWPLIDFSQFSFRSWFDYSVDNVVWTFVTVIETLALVAMLCCFCIFCGCTI